MTVGHWLSRLWLRWHGPPTPRTVSQVVSILERELQGIASTAEWDDFISVPIADPYLDGIRTRHSFAGNELPESRQIIEQSLAALRARQ
jgi:hypothetical protein